MPVVFARSFVLGSFPMEQKFDRNGRYVWRSERALKQRNPSCIESCGAPLLLCSDYVPLRVALGMFCRLTRLRSPEYFKVEPLEASTPEAVGLFFFT